MNRLREDPLWRAMPLLEVNWRRVVQAVTLGSLALGSAVGLAAVSAWLIARASQMPPVLTLSVAVVSVRAFGISRGVFRYLERLASHDIALRGMAALRANLYDALARGSATHLVALRRGDLLARVGADVDAVGDAVVRSLIPAGVAAVISVGSVVLVGAFLPWAGVTLAACLVVAALVSPWLSARSARLVEARGAQVRAEMTSATLEILESAGPLSVSGRLPVQSQALRAADRGLAKVTDDGARSSALAAGLLVAAVGVAALASLLLGIPAVEAGTLAPVELSVIVLTPLAVFEAAGVLPAAAVQWHRSSQAARRVLDLLDPVAGAQSPADSPAEPMVSVAAGTAPTLGLQLAEASCAWPTSPAPVVAAIDIEVPAGRSVAVVGPSGVGKTTLLMTAAGLLPPVSGTVTLDGTASSDLDPQGARRAVFVAEDGHVFDTTILENLRVARGDLTEHEAVAALTEVGLNEWLDTLPDGVETLLGADATTISGGERRRLLIARALLAPASYLLVDEPAEHLDGPTADTLVRLLARDAREHGRGVLIATHRLSALDAVDEVIVLARPQAPEAEPGIAEADTAARIVARGTHAELMLTPAYRWALDQETV